MNMGVCRFVRRKASASAIGVAAEQVVPADPLDRGDFAIQMQ